ncbi:sensor histidine kinase [Streptomyces sp. CLV115]|uniref:sensor histidine kinase n=1 Tax=Streptomyces sp. CLV115 TaxID=3138502 RepID=UPI00406D38CA
MLDRLDRSFTAQRSFTAHVSHELRTPLILQRTALEIPLAQGRVPAGLRPDIRRALGANARTEQLIAALTSARGESEKLTPNPVDLAHVAMDAVSDLADAGLTLRRLRRGALTHDAEDGTSTPMLPGPLPPRIRPLPGAVRPSRRRPGRPARRRTRPRCTSPQANPGGSGLQDHRRTTTPVCPGPPGVRPASPGTGSDRGCPSGAVVGRDRLRRRPRE